MNNRLLAMFTTLQPSTTERLAIILIKSQPGITYPELSVQMGVTIDRARRIVWKLRDAGLVALKKSHKEFTTVHAAGEAARERDWQDYVDVADQPLVYEALQAFAGDSTEDNAITLIQAIEEHL